MAGAQTAIVVPGHGDLDLDGVHRITRRCLRLVQEAEQMRNAWRGPDVELVVEPTARNTAENAARTLTLLRDRGIVRAVVVVAPTHLARTRLLFGRLYRSAGVEVAFRAVAVAPSLRSIAWELAAFPFLPAQLRAARAELARRSR